jgi:hypothetical protein
VKIEQGVETALKADAGILARVAQRIFFMQAPEQASSPYLVHRPVSGPRLRAGNAVLAFFRPRWEVACWAVRADDAQEIARLVRDLFDGYAGTLGGVGGVVVKSAVYEETRIYQDPSNLLWNCPVEIFFFHRED